eukprot:2331725-Rhodomonas_salina.1
MPRPRQFKVCASGTFRGRARGLGLRDFFQHASGLPDGLPFFMSAYESYDPTKDNKSVTDSEKSDLGQL